MAELFCAAAASIKGTSAVVRLHPSEQLDRYAPVAKRHPNVRFLMNRDATLDEALAAADIVVVPNSGFGSDALVKRRLAIVLDLPGMRLGHGRELIEQAGCPRATTAEQLAEVIQELLTNQSARSRHFAAAERYIEDFCICSGQIRLAGSPPSSGRVCPRGRHFPRASRPRQHESEFISRKRADER